MFEAFDAAYRPDGSVLMPESGGRIDAAPELQLFFNRYGGCSFNNGIYRALSADSAPHWSEYVSTAFPHTLGRITCFGVDWLGRIFAVDSQRSVEDLPGVVLYEPGTGDSFEIPGNILTFHNRVLIDQAEAALAESFYRKWIEEGGAPPQIHQCVGYKRPLFLGGQDHIPNLELSDMDVYWHLLSQLIQRTRDLPEGTPIGPITMTDPY